MSIETGRLAKQAHGSVLVRYGDTMILAAVVGSKQPREGIDFLPLFVDYRERSYAGGKIPGGFFKREGRPGINEILTSRLIDRPMRPLFPKHIRNELQVIIHTLSSDQVNPPDVLGMIAASAAVSISNLPFNGPVGAVRTVLNGDEFIINPTFEQIEGASLR